MYIAIEDGGFPTTVSDSKQVQHIQYYLKI